MSAASGDSVALLVPTGRDGTIAQQVLEAEGFAARVCPDIGALCDAVGAGIGALLVAEEALTADARRQLLAALDAQPSWSDVPLVVLTGEGELSRTVPKAVGAVAARGNVTLLERPVRVATLVTTLRSALRARRRQFEVRDYLDEREVAERSLRESESRLRDAVVSAPYPLMLHADDGEILQLSRAWSMLTGYSRAELRTTADWSARAYGDRAAEANAFIAAEFDACEAAGGASLPAGEWTVRVADGGERVWDFHTVALGRLPDRRRLNLTAAADVTEFKRLIESERGARHQAEAANRAKSEFLAVMSHELRTPSAGR